jgi:hypothetical protein
MRMLVAGILLIAMLAVAGFAAIYFTEASIHYSLDVYRYEKIDGKWYSILGDNPRLNGTLSSVHLENKGLFDGTFRLIIKLTNATCYNSSLPVSNKGNENEANIPLTLKAQQQTDELFYFNVTGNQFTISIDLQPDQLLLRSTEANWGNQNTFHYASPDYTSWIPPVIA